MNRVLALRDDGFDGIRAPQMRPGLALLVTVAGVAALAAGFVVDAGDVGGAALWGVLAFAILGMAGRSTTEPGLAWWKTPLLRAGEYGAILVVGASIGEAGLAFALLAAIAFHHYDTAYRVEHSGPPPRRWVSAAGLGWQGRTLLVVAAALQGAGRQVLLGLTIYLAVLFAGESLVSWVRVRTTASRDRGTIRA